MSIFISYRRADTQQAAGRLADRLMERFGRESVVIDVDTDQVGRDYRKLIADRLEHADVVLALIGARYMEAGSDGRKRLDRPNDTLRMELARALARDVVIIPVLVDGAELPDPDALPEDLRDLVYRGAIELSHHRFDRDYEFLEERVERLMTEAAEQTAREAAEQEAAAQTAREAAEKQAAAQTAREAAEKQAAAQTAREAAEKQAAAQTAREAAEKEAAAQAAREAAEKEAAAQAAVAASTDAVTPTQRWRRAASATHPALLATVAVVTVLTIVAGISFAVSTWFGPSDTPGPSGQPEASASDEQLQGAATTATSQASPSEATTTYNQTTTTNTLPPRPDEPAVVAESTSPRLAPLIVGDTVWTRRGAQILILDRRTGGQIDAVGVAGQITEWWQTGEVVVTVSAFELRVMDTATRQSVALAETPVEWTPGAWFSDGEYIAGVDAFGSEVFYGRVGDSVMSTVTIPAAEGESRSRPSIVRNVAIIPGLNAVYVLDMSDGTTKTLELERFTATAEGAVVDGLVYVPEIIGGALTVVDPLTPTIVNRIWITDQRLGAVATDGSRVFVTLTDEAQVAGFDPASGETTYLDVEGKFPWYVWASNGAITVLSPTDDVWSAIELGTGEPLDLSTCELGCSSIRPADTELYAQTSSGLLLLPFA